MLSRSEKLRSVTVPTRCSQKGDRFETECFYDTVLSSVGSENVTFGIGSENEMSVGVDQRRVGQESASMISG